MKKQLLLLVMILLPMVASADPVEIDGIYYNLISKTQNAEVTSNPNGYTGTIVIPESVNYETIKYSVTGIGKEAFAHCDNLTSINIPNSVTSIGFAAFDFSMLTSITIPNSVTSIGALAFANCYGLNSITIPNSVTSFGNSAFSGCSGLTSVTIGDGVTSIGNDAFSRCTSLNSITIGNSVTNIGKNAFEGCTALTSITFPNSVLGIGNWAFKNCSGLTSVIIPNSVIFIGVGAFSGCSGLTSIIIGNGINMIEAWAFSNCPELTDVYCYAINVPEGYSAFGGSYIEYATLHVPAESVNAYKASALWNGFKEIVALTDSDPKPDATGINVIENTKDNKFVIYNLNGVRLSEPQKGINIINGKKYVKK